MKLSREFKTGIVVIVVIFLFIYGFNYLKGEDIFKRHQRLFYIEYDDVQGLNLASKVTLNGLNVGRVTDIFFNKDPDKKGQIIVEISVKTKLPFTENSIAKIYSASLTSGQVIAILPSFVGDPAKSGIFLKGEVEPDLVNSLAQRLKPLQERLASVLISTDSLVIGLNEVLNSQSKVLIRGTIENLNSSMSNFNKISLDLSNIIGKKGSFQKTLDNLSVFTDSINKLDLSTTVSTLNGTLENVDKLINTIQEGEGSLGEFIKNDTLYQNLEKASYELENLVKDVRINPKRYVHFSIFGKSDDYKDPNDID